MPQGILLSVAGDQEGADPRIITHDNPLPVSLKPDDGHVQSVSLPDPTHETDSFTVLTEIARKLDILIEYQAMLHDIDLGVKS